MERILGIRVDESGTSYRVKWKGYKDKDNTWEPERNMDCPDLIKEFKEADRANKLKLIKKIKKSASDFLTRSKVASVEKGNNGAPNNKSEDVMDVSKKTTKALDKEYEEARIDYYGAKISKNS